MQYRLLQPARHLSHVQEGLFAEKKSKQKKSITGWTFGPSAAEERCIIFCRTLSVLAHAVAPIDLKSMMTAWLEFQFVCKKTPKKHCWSFTVSLSSKCDLNSDLWVISPAPFSASSLALCLLSYSLCVSYQIVEKKTPTNSRCKSQTATFVRLNDVGLLFLRSLPSSHTSTRPSFISFFLFIIKKVLPKFEKCSN